MKVFRTVFVILLLLTFLSPLLALVYEGGTQLFQSSQSSPSTDTRLLLTFGWTSLQLVVGSVLGAIVFGCVAAFLCARFEFRFRKWVFWLSIFPLAVPSYLVSYAWVDFLIDNGVAGGKLRNLGTTCLVFSLCLSPYVFLPVHTALHSVSRSVLESAQLLGQSPWKVFLKIELPLIAPSLLAGATLAGLEVLGDFGTVDFMAIDTWTTGIYRSWFGYGDRSHAALLALMLFSLSSLFLFWQSYSHSKNQLTTGVRSSALVHRKKLPLVKLLPCVLFALLPPLAGCLGTTLILLWKSSQRSGLEIWLNVATPTATTVSTALFAGLLVVLLGLALTALLRSKSTAHFVRIIGRLSSLGYAFPGSVLGLGILILLAPLSLTGTIAGLLFAYVVRFATIGTTTLEAAWLTLPAAYSEQAQLLGCTRVEVFTRVTFPLLRKSIFCALVLTSIDIIKELPATMLLRPFNFETLALRTYTLASDERIAETAPSALAMIILCGAGIVLAKKLGAFHDAPAALSEKGN